jgi:hypothetical protein
MILPLDDDVNSRVKIKMKEGNTLDMLQVCGKRGTLVAFTNGVRECH